MKGTRFEAVLLIGQTVTGELKVIQEETFIWAPHFGNLIVTLYRYTILLVWSLENR
jgi:hypothetical protein